MRFLLPVPQKKSRAPWIRVLGALVALLAVTFLNACGAGGEPQITIDGQEAWISAAMLGVGSVFMSVHNTGNGSDALVGVRAGIQGAFAELHDTRDGKMIKKERLPIPSGSTVELKPGGMHIMIFKLPKDIKKGAELPLILIFERSGERLVRVQVTKAPDKPYHY
ncbi:MAG: copper chaperone PCu(A)C [Nitrospirota bacterium]